MERRSFLSRKYLTVTYHPKGFQELLSMYVLGRFSECTQTLRKIMLYRSYCSGCSSLTSLSRDQGLTPYNPETLPKGGMAVTLYSTCVRYFFQKSREPDTSLQTASITNVASESLRTAVNRFVTQVFFSLQFVTDGVDNIRHILNLFQNKFAEIYLPLVIIRYTKCFAVNYKSYRPYITLPPQNPPRQQPTKRRSHPSVDVSREQKEDLAYAAAVCEQAGVPLEVVSLQREYWEQVVSYTIREAREGRTPNPDVMCNSRIKFGMFYDHIGRHFRHVATGHYARLERWETSSTPAVASTSTSSAAFAAGGNGVDMGSDGQARLLLSPDAVKDQTYFLCALNQTQLRKALFPIGAYTKERVRELAEEYDLPTKSRKDSQASVCVR